MQDNIVIRGSIKINSICIPNQWRRNKERLNNLITLTQRGKFRSVLTDEKWKDNS